MNQKPIGKELQERFAAKKKADTTSSTTSLSELLGITAVNMIDTITADIVAMIEKDYRRALEGYIFCLSRIMKHDMAWQCILDAFSKTGEKVPKKYYKQFGKDPEQLTKWRGMNVE